MFLTMALMAAVFGFTAMAGAPSAWARLLCAVFSFFFVVTSVAGWRRPRSNWTQAGSFSR